MTGGTGISCTGGTYTKLYWRSLSGDALGESDGSGSTTNAAYTEYVFFAGRRVASRSGTGALFYFFADQLGSTRIVTTGNGPGQTPGQLCYDQDYTPYGQEVFTTAQMSRLQTTACPPSYKFTGHERDPETTSGANDTGLDYAFARYYSSRLGRFLSIDPLGGSIGSLQSHNAYAYTGNNPLNHIDPSGMVDCHPEEGCWPLFFGPNNPANGLDFNDITNGALNESDQEIARDIRAQNRFAFTAVAPFFQAWADFLKSIDEENMRLSTPPGGDPPSMTIIIDCSGDGYMSWECIPRGAYAGLLMPGWSPYFSDSDAKLRYLARAIYGRAGAVGDWRFIAGFYGLSIAGASLLNPSALYEAGSGMYTDLGANFATWQTGGLFGSMDAGFAEAFDILANSAPTAFSITGTGAGAFIGVLVSYLFDPPSYSPPWKGAPFVYPSRGRR
jgi:RHS repeat-associated protein